MRRAKHERGTGGKLVLSTGFIIASLAYALWQRPDDELSAAVKAPVTTPASALPAVPAASAKPSGAYTDGSYDGTAVDAYYGTVQVKAVVSGGRIADVQFLQHPQSHANSIFINAQAMPLLTQEAIQAQSAQVDGVSGATFTSQAFKQSLAAALALAKN